jgi:hypothetical protein
MTRNPAGERPRNCLVQSFPNILRSGEKDILTFAGIRRGRQRSPTHKLQTPPANAPTLTLDYQSNGTP